MKILLFLSLLFTSINLYSECLKEGETFSPWTGGECCEGLEAVELRKGVLDSSKKCVKKSDCFKEGQWLPTGFKTACCPGLKAVRKTGDPFLGSGYCSPKNCIEEGKKVSSSQKCCPGLEKSDSLCILKTCHAEIIDFGNGQFKISSNDYPNEHSTVEVEDDDGYLGLLIFNSKLDRYEEEYIMTMEDKNLIRASFLKAKKYWREDYGLDIKDNASFEENIKAMKIEDIKNKVGSNYGPNGPAALHKVAKEYFELLSEIEEVLKASKLDKEQRKKLVSLLKKDHDKHGYYLNGDKPVGKFCGVKGKGNFENDNILRQSVCSKLDFEDNPFEETPQFEQSMRCNVRYKVKYQEEPMKKQSDETLNN